jgi:hypothetical protein
MAQLPPSHGAIAAVIRVGESVQRPVKVRGCFHRRGDVRLNREIGQVDFTNGR